MTPQEYMRLCELFDQARSLPSAERADLLRQARAADSAMGVALERFLSADAGAREERLLVSPCPVNAKEAFPTGQSLAALTDTPAEPPADELIGRRVGPYLIQQRVGHGGMGTVYRAQREDAYRQQVALKVIRPGLGTAELVRRFRTERQVLAELEHPHIGRLLDGGATEAGAPYFVMEYIDGEALDKYCDNRELPTPERVRLLRDVCAAVQHAHEHGVVHRDLKPANVLVTTGGVAKVTDFGLAKRLEGDAGETAAADQTGSGAILGTPSYMAPEQAAGRRAEVGPAADVYALGATLYELLTGRPPFRAETPLDTLLQVIQEEPIPPSRLHPKLARDLETVCLKCLCKEPEKRYGSARALSDDLGRFLAGEPVQARRVGAFERALKWVRRRPALAALAALLLLVVFGVGAGASAWAWRRAEQARSVTGDLDQAGEAVRAGRLPEARTTMERAEGRVATGGPADLLRRVQGMRDALGLVNTLDRIRLQRAAIVGVTFDHASADRDYARAFADAGLGEPGADPAEAAARVRDSVLQPQLVAALDDWAAITRDRARRAWLLEVACRADPGDWSDRFRDPAVWENRAALEKLAKEADVAKLSPQLLAALGVVLRDRGADPVPLLTAAQKRHPADFWLNLEFAKALNAQGKAADAVGYERVALALRPGTPAVYTNLGTTMFSLNRWDEAIAAYRQALELDPGLALTRTNLGNALMRKGLLDEAIREHRLAIQINPQLATANTNLSGALLANKQVDEAIRETQTALKLNPKDAGAYTNLGAAQAAKGRLDEAVASYEKAIALDPRRFVAHYNLGNIHLEKGRWQEAIAGYQKAIAINPKFWQLHLNLGIALQQHGRLDEAIQAYRAALELSPKDANIKMHLDNALAARK